MLTKKNRFTTSKACGSPRFLPFHFVFPEEKRWASWIWLRDFTPRCGIPGKVLFREALFLCVRASIFVVFEACELCNLQLRHTDGWVFTDLMPGAQLNRVRFGQRSPTRLSITSFCQQTLIFIYFWAFLWFPEEYFHCVLFSINILWSERAFS